MKTRDSFNNSSIKVPFFYPSITKDDKKAINKALSSPLLTDGPQLRKFELAFSKFTGTKYAIGVSNGTAALQLALKAAGIHKGDEVIIPDLTFVATASAVLLSGATPVLADVDTDTLNISPESVKKNITTKTKAILPVHFAGRICNMEQIQRIADSNNLIVIEDCAHAIGAKCYNKHAGTFGDAGCFSFYPTKNFTTIEGGMVITNNKKIAQHVIKARNHGITKSLFDRFSSGKPWEYDVIEPGYNYRLDEVRATLGLSQIKRVNKMNSQRRKAFEYYNSKLNKVKGIITPRLSTSHNHAFHLYILRITKQFHMSRDKLFDKLLQNGIRSSVHYKPIHKFTAFKKYARVYGNLKNTELLFNEIISIPIYPSITKNEQDFVIQNILN